MENVKIIVDAAQAGMSLEKDNYGQIVINTGMKWNEDGEIIPMTEEDFNNEEAWYKK